MGEKHLTELPWKTLAVKKGIKDGDLTKALAAFAKVDESDPTARLKSLDKILTTAEVVKRNNKAQPDVVSYLDEILKEARKNRAHAKGAPAAAAKSATPADDEEAGEEEEDDANAVDEEAEQYKKDYKGKLLSAMAQVKARAPKPGDDPKPQMQFLALLGSKESSVLVAANVGGPARKVLRGLAGGAKGAFASGECIYEKNAYTFVAATVPGGLAKKISGALRAQTGMTYKVRVRTADGDVVLDDETDVDPEEAASTVPGVSGDTDPAEAAGANLAAIASDDSEARWKQLKAAVYPKLKERLEQNPANRADIVNLVGEASYHEKQTNFKDAIRAFQRLSDLLEKASTVATGATPAATQTAAPAANPEERTLFMDRFKLIQPMVLAAVTDKTPQADEVKLRASEAGVLARKQDFAGALRLLDGIESLLGGTTAATQGRATGQATGANVQYQKSILDWEKVKGQVRANLSKLEQAIVADFADEPKLGAIKSGLKKLEQVLGGFDERLRDKLDEAYNAPTPDLLPPLHEEAREIVDDYLDYVESDDFINAIDSNPFTAVSVREPLSRTLQDIAGQLKA